MNPFGYHPIPKNTYKSKKHSTDFSPATRKAIIERDGGSCIKCGRKASAIHHINFRSEHKPWTTHKRNGASTCVECHSFAHSGKDGRQWFIDWRERTLDENGDKKESET